MIHSRIGKYRIDPLTESERSNIIDQVYFTAESMLSSIKELHNSSHRNKLPTRQENNTMDTTMVDDISSSSTSSLNKVRALFKEKKSFFFFNMCVFYSWKSLLQMIIK